MGIPARRGCLYPVSAMKKYALILLAVLACITSQAQTKTTQDFHEKHEDATALFFYRNTIRMLAQLMNEERVDDIVKEIERMKFLTIEKSEDFLSNEYTSLVESYEEESFEDLMNMRSDGMNMNVMIHEEAQVTKGLVVLIDDEENFMILDVEGAVPLDKIAELITYVQSADGFDFD